MTDQEVASATGLAVNPAEGKEFKLGDKTLNLQFLTYDGEQALTGIMKDRIVELMDQGVETDEAVMAATGDLLPSAVAAIVADYEGPYANVAEYRAACAVKLAWVRSIRRPMTETMYTLVKAQWDLNQLGNVLRGLLQADVLMRAAMHRDEA